ncbi:hypothetical protein V8J36_05430 [Frigidibacter sp. MR17.14]|uniref:hypothetical protein n=1 Tax=Frigidibacter sp. MR17.14 TaxID=3126509 RepID=UPI003012E176
MTHNQNRPPSPTAAAARALLTGPYNPTASGAEARREAIRVLHAARRPDRPRFRVPPSRGDAA